MQEKELERVFKALANKRRLAILRHLKKHREATVADIAETIKLSFKATSKHLGILFAAGIVEREQRSLYMLYGLAKSMPGAAHRVLPLL
jgi:DNA-binding transcriptional ArsR family regulator